MRASILSACGFALFASASPQNECSSALRHYPSAKAACSSYLKATVTPCVKTHVVTKTATKTRTATVTSTTVTITKTDAAAVTTKPKSGAARSLGNKRRAQPKCPSSSTPSKVPTYLDQSCNAKAFSSACSALGVKPTTKTLAASTVTTTKTVSATTTKTVVISATKTVTATETPKVEDCFYLSSKDQGQDGWLYVGLTSGGFRHTITDEVTAFRLAANGNIFTRDTEFPVSIGYTRVDHPLSTSELGVDYLYFTSDFTQQTLFCSIQGGQLHCDSTAHTGQVRSDLVYCTWQSESTSPRTFAFNSGAVPSACKPAVLGVVPCAEMPPITP